ncbi:MAG: hypothetical protein WD627_06570, partial [Actinomycetota bacterium]
GRDSHPLAQHSFQDAPSPDSKPPGPVGRGPASRARPPEKILPGTVGKGSGRARPPEKIPMD